MIKDKIKAVEKDMNAKTEQMLLFQVLEEHIDKSPKCKKVETCENCIRLALNKGYRLGKKECEEEIMNKETFFRDCSELKSRKEKELEEEMTKLQEEVEEKKNVIDFYAEILKETKEEQTAKVKKLKKAFSGERNHSRDYILKEIDKIFSQEADLQERK